MDLLPTLFNAIKKPDVTIKKITQSAFDIYTKDMEKHLLLIRKESHLSKDLQDEFIQVQYMD